MTSIRIEGVEKAFPGVRALENVRIDIGKGEFFTLLGPSGCGKTTLLRTIAGFYRQDAGRILLGDEVIDEVPPWRRDTGMVFQNYAVFPHMTVFDNVAFGLKNRHLKSDEIRARVTKALAMARLTGLERRTPDQLSGGQQQRVGLARAVVIEPRVLLMDEPLSNLDAKLRVEMRVEIRDLQRQLGITTVYVTHDQEEALVISDRIAVMKAGVVQQVGRPWEIYKSPVNTFVASFVGTMNFLEGEVVDGAVAFGPHRLPLPAGVRASGKVTVCVRPEEIGLSIGDAAALDRGPATSIPGTVRSCTFTGPLASYVLDCAGTPITIERHRPAATDLLAAGTGVHASIPSAALLAFDPVSGVRL
jgi:ABC-type Fe3+/spermidine/putrescine transport system ATPase subunit